MDSLSAELVIIRLKKRARILFKEALNDPQSALVVNLGPLLKSLQRLDYLHGQPITLVSDLANDHLIKSLQAPLVKYRQHTIISYLKLIAIGLGEGKLGLFFLV